PRPNRRRSIAADTGIVLSYSPSCARFIANGRTGLRAAPAGISCPKKTLAGRASHDAHDNRGHAAFYRARFGDRHFFRVHSALEFENPAFDCRGMAMSM